MARKPIKKLKRKSRNITTPNGMSPAEKQTRSAIAYITGNAHYQAILGVIRQGVPNTTIAEHLIARGIFDCNQKTAVGYLQYFRKAQPHLCRPQRPTGSEESTAPIASYDHLFDGNMAIVDPEVELLKLISLQKARLGMGFNSEREINLLMQTNRKEVQELRELLMDLAKLRGMWGNSMDVNLHGYSETVKDDLKGIQQDEGQRNVIATLVADLGNMDSGTKA